MNTLLLQTATEICSVAVARAGSIVAEATAPGPHLHASQMTLLIDRVLTEAGLSCASLDAIALSDGPGSFTSLRVGAATAKGIHFAYPEIQLHVVPTLSALARAADPGGADRILATLLSRRGEVYGQVFGAKAREPETDPMNIRLTDPKWRGKLLEGRSLGRVLLCGPGSERVAKRLENDNAFRPGEPRRATAAHLLGVEARVLRSRAEVAAYEPFYLNPPYVTVSKKKPLL